jgi:hypothetical protein
MRDRAMGSPAGTAGSNDDNIQVAYSRATDSSEDDWESTSESRGLTRPETNTYIGKGKGKAPVRPIDQDADMMDMTNLSLTSMTTMSPSTLSSPRTTHTRASWKTRAMKTLARTSVFLTMSRRFLRSWSPLTGRT